MVQSKTINRPAQRWLSPEFEECLTSKVNGSHEAAKCMTLREYMKTRDFLWRLLACFPGDVPLVDALAAAPRVIFGISRGQEGGAA